MRFATLGTYWGNRLAVLLDDSLVDISAAYAAYAEEMQHLRRDRAVQLAQLNLPADVNAFILAGHPAWDRAAETADWARDILKRDPDRLSSCTWQQSAAPIVGVCPRPPKVWCMGANYMAHRTEMAQRRGTENEMNRRAQGFIKSPTAIIGPYDPIVLPPESQRIEYEMELAVVIGRGGRRISEERAMDHVFGYTVFNDVSSRDVAELDNGRMDRGKGFDTFAVMGPWLVTRDEIADPHNLRLSLHLNGELRQDASTDDMLYRIPQQIAWLSTAMTLEPGDIISTGSPSGVGRISPGDLIEGEVENVGAIRNRVIAEELHES